jgi:hypothetical protein
MKYLKLFEDSKNMRKFEKVPAIRYEDDYLKIHKIKEGPNKGKIIFKFNEKIDRGLDWSSLSVMSGCAKILDTKYEKIPEIRNIELSDDKKFRRVHSNSIDVILQNFLRQIQFMK